MEKMVGNKDICKEVFVVLSNFNKDIIKKIPDNIFKILMDGAADSTLDVNIDINKDINEQKISQESKELISILYYQYIAEADEKKELIKLWELNDKNKGEK